MVEPGNILVARVAPGRVEDQLITVYVRQRKQQITDADSRPAIAGSPESHHPGNALR